MAQSQVNLHGTRLGIAATGQLVSGGIDITSPAVDATITVGAENTNVRAITIQLKDANGADVTSPTIVDIFVFANSTGDAIATTGGSTGIAIGTDGAILTTLIAKKRFEVVSEADGDIDLTWTDTGTEVAYLGVRLPTGRIVISTALTNT